MANRTLGDNTLNLLTTEYGPYTAFGGVPRPVMNGADVAGAERQACDEDVMFRAVCARLAKLVEHGAAAQTQAGVLECVAALGQLHEHVVEERERHRRCEQSASAPEWRGPWPCCRDSHPPRDSASSPVAPACRGLRV